MSVAMLAQAPGWPHVSLAVLAAVLFAVAAFVLAVRLRRVARKLHVLAAAADRIGLGDFTTPIPAFTGRHSGRLSYALEVMRRRINALTSNLMSRQAEAQAIITGVAEGVFTVDRERRVRYLNPQMERMLGVTGNAALGRFCGDVLQPQGPGGVRPCEEDCPIVHARFRGGARATEHLTIPGGGRRTCVITSAPMTSDLQVQVFRDESEVEATRRLRDAVLANISHEFRTPLSAQLASIELLLDRLPELGAKEVSDLLLSLHRGTLRLMQLIDNLLESVRIEAGEAGIRRRPVALDEVVEEAVEMTRPLLEQRGQEIAVDLPYPIPPIEGDAPRLVQVLVNLLANASKFAPEGSTVAIGAQTTADGVKLWIQDQGPGFPVGEEAAPFTRFWRAADGEPAEGGAGLGLYIAKSIVERHGGRIEAASGAGGTRMTVVLPLP